MNLATKTIFLLLSITLITMGVFTYLEYGRTKSIFEKDFFDTQNLFFTNAITGLGNALWNLDKPSAEAVLTPLIANQRFATFQIYKKAGPLFMEAAYKNKGVIFKEATDAPGYLVAHTNKETLEEIEKKGPQFKPRILSKNNLHTFLSGVWFQESPDRPAELLGVVVGNFSSEHIEIYMKEQLFRLLRVNIFLSVILASGALAFLLFTVIRPVGRLQKASQRIANGEYIHVEEPKGKDEIASLSHNFNLMTSSIERNIDELQQINDIAKLLSRSANFNELAHAVIKFTSLATNDEIKVCVFGSIDPSHLNIIGGDKKLIDDNDVISTSHVLWKVAIEEQFFGVIAVCSSDIDKLKTWMEGSVYKAVSLSLAFSWERITKGILETELSAGKLVQETLLPSHANIPGVEIAASVTSAAQTGGDWYGFYFDEVSKNMLLFVGDVTGHGFPSALVTGVICGAVYSGEKRADQMRTQGALIDYHERLITTATILNDIILTTSSRSGRLMTMAIAAFNLNTGRLLYVNAGHNPPLLVQNDKIRTLNNVGSRLGYNNRPEFKVKEAQLEIGDSIIFYTDGLVENTGPHGGIFSFKELKASISRESSAQEIHDGVLEHGRTIWQQVAPADDVTLLVTKWTERIQL